MPPTNEGWLVGGGGLPGCTEGCRVVSECHLPLWVPNKGVKYCLDIPRALEWAVSRTFC